MGDIEFDGLNEMDALFDKALEFYRGTQTRDKWMLQNIKERLEATGQNKAVVVTGGFHAGPFGDYFQANGASYVLVAPKISVIEGRELYVKSVLDYQIKETGESTYEIIPLLASSPAEMKRLGFDPEKVRRDTIGVPKPVTGHRETVPREEPEEVPMPETVPAEPEPAPAPVVPEKEPAPLPEPAPAEPDKELIPAGRLVSMRSEVRSDYDQIQEIKRSIQRNPVNASIANLKFMLEKLSDPYWDVRQAALQAIPYFVQADKGAFTAPNLKFMLEKLSDPDGDVRQAALQAIPYFVSVDPNLRSIFASYRDQIEETLSDHLGFPKAVVAKSQNTPLTELITLGAKVGAGTGEKKIAPADSDPARLARWIIQYRNGDRIQELQISIGFDTSMLPSQEHRGKFIALFLFIASTYLKDFQPLEVNPKRDLNAAHGLIIRGHVVEEKLPGQMKGRRLDYIFNLSREMTEKNLSELLRQIQLLNLGLLLATAEDSYQLFFPNETPPWLDARTRATAEEYRKFERGFVKLLRAYDNFRDPDTIIPSSKHSELNQVWRNASMKYRHEEALYPVYRWLQPLYQPDQYWQALLPVLRIIEGTMRSKRASDKVVVNLKTNAQERRPVGLQFKRDIGMLGYEIMKRMEGLLSTESIGEIPEAPGRDPFIDDTNPEATQVYLQQMADAIEQGRLSLAELPDAKTFLRALSRYNITARRSELRKVEGKSFFLPPSTFQLRPLFFVHRETVPRYEPEEVPMPETVPAEPEPAPAPVVPEKEPAPLPEPAPAEPVPAEPDKELVPAGIMQILTPGLKALFDISEQALPIRYFTRFDYQSLVDLLRKLLDREVYSEKAGILPETRGATVNKGPVDGRMIRMLGWDADAAGYIVGEELFFMGLPAALEAFGVDEQKPIVVITSGRDTEERPHHYNAEMRLSQVKPPVLAARDAREAVRIARRELAQRKIHPQGIARLQGLLSPGDLKWEEALLKLQVTVAPLVDQRKFENVIKLFGLTDLVEAFRSELRIRQAA